MSLEFKQYFYTLLLKHYYYNFIKAAFLKAYISIHNMDIIRLSETCPLREKCPNKELFLACILLYSD